jgi:hypothetical protein
MNTGSQLSAFKHWLDSMVAPKVSMEKKYQTKLKLRAIFD